MSQKMMKWVSLSVKRRLFRERTPGIPSGAVKLSVEAGFSASRVCTSCFIRSISRRHKNWYGFSVKTKRDRRERTTEKGSEKIKLLPLSIPLPKPVRGVKSTFDAFQDAFFWRAFLESISHKKRKKKLYFTGLNDSG